jgi:hypothetical protein
VPPTEIFPLINGKTLFVGAAVAGAKLKSEIKRTAIEMLRTCLEERNLFMAKSFHLERISKGIATVKALNSHYYLKKAEVHLRLLEVSNTLKSL